MAYSLGDKKVLGGNLSKTAVTRDVFGVEMMLGDSSEKMGSIPDGSIDLTVTSPPYDNLRKYNGKNKIWTFDKFKSIAEELYRVTADGGVVVWVVNDAVVNGSETGTSFKQALYFMDCGFRLYDTMIWSKPSPAAPTEGRYYDTFEHMFVFSKGKPKTLNLLCDRRNKSAGSVSNKETRSCREDRKTKAEKRVVKEYSRRFNVWEISRGHNKTEHPAVFPVKLAHDHIVSWSNKGDTVLDPFMGSGTTGVACAELGRKFVGIELDESYYKVAKDRIEFAYSAVKAEVCGEQRKR